MNLDILLDLWDDKPRSEQTSVVANPTKSNKIVLDNRTYTPLYMKGVLKGYTSPNKSEADVTDMFDLNLNPSGSYNNYFTR
jgi:hypothetical protein